MKKIVRIVSLLLVVAILATGAMAASVYDVAIYTSKYGDCKVVNHSEKGEVSFTTAYADGKEKASCVFENTVKFDVSFSPETTTDQFMVFMLKDGADGIPTEDNIVYINQNGAASKQSFTVYPKDLLAGAYNIWVSSQTDELQMLASLTVAESVKAAEFMFGDVEVDQKVNIADVMKMLNAIAGNTELVGNQIDAADVNSSNTVNIADVLAVLNYIAGNIKSY